MTASATLVLANHRPETIPLARRLMAVHDTIVLEEPPDKRFEPMLDGEISIDAYLEDQELEYLEFSQRMALVLRERRQAGTRLVQVEPFIDLLLSIHDRFANGEGPRDLPADTDLYRVYQAEHQATKTLIDFYQASGGDHFDTTVDAVKRFARADARRFALRDQMRAEAMVALIQHSGKTYIEAGQIHYPLWHELRRRLPVGFPLRVHFLMTAVVRKLGYRRHLFGPGDLLTLYYRFHPRGRFQVEDLLAARALIYNKLILKDEIAADADTYPHTRDELEVGSVTDRLSLDDCRLLYTRVWRASPSQSREIVMGFLGSRR
ncbi:MAG: hypothetical protein R6V60_09010 [Desulfobacterales bacterium]